MSDTKVRFSKSYILDRLENDLTKIEAEHGWKRNHVGTAEIARCRDKDKAFELGRYLALTDLLEDLNYEFGG